MKKIFDIFFEFIHNLYILQFYHLATSALLLISRLINVIFALIYLYICSFIDLFAVFKGAIKNSADAAWNVRAIVELRKGKEMKGNNHNVFYALLWHRPREAEDEGWGSRPLRLDLK